MTMHFPSTDERDGEPASLSFRKSPPAAFGMRAKRIDNAAPIETSASAMRISARSRVNSCDRLSGAGSFAMKSGYERVWACCWGSRPRREKAMIGPR